MMGMFSKGFFAYCSYGTLLEQKNLFNMTIKCTTPGNITITITESKVMNMIKMIIKKLLVELRESTDVGAVA